MVSRGSSKRLLTCPFGRCWLGPRSAHGRQINAGAGRGGLDSRRLTRRRRAVAVRRWRRCRRRRSSWPGTAGRPGGGIAGQDVLTGDLAAFDRGHPALGHPHPLGDLGLGEPPPTTDLGQPVPNHLRSELVLGGGHRFFPTVPGDPGDPVSADLAPRHVTVNDRPSCSPRPSNPRACSGRPGACRTRLRSTALASTTCRKPLNIYRFTASL